MFSGEGELWNVDCWNLWVLVMTNSGRACVSVDRHPEGKPVFLDLSNRWAGVIAFRSCVMLLFVTYLRW